MNKDSPSRKDLKPGEELYVAKVKLLLNFGKMSVEPGKVIILGPDDEAAGINLKNLIKNGGVEVYTTEKRAREIREEWETEGKPRRKSLKARNRRSR